MPLLDPRVLEVYARRDDLKAVKIGTGYLLDGGLVLTAGHVLTDALKGPVEVRRPGRGERWPCSIAWCRNDPKGDGSSAPVDAALLRVDVPSWTEPGGLPPVRWGRLVTDLPTTPVVVSSVPAGMDTSFDGGRPTFRDTSHNSGRLNTGTRSGYLVLTPTHQIPERSGVESRWKGGSGAAVLTSGMVIGTAVRANGNDVEVLLVTEMATDEEFRALVGPLDFEPAELRSVLDADAPRHAHSPVSLLTAEAEAVRFHGRDGLIGHLESWCHESHAFSVRLLTGQGGQGKTRLARHLTAVLRGGGWVAGFLDDRIDAKEVAVLGRVTSPLLLVVDYAEDRKDHLVELLRLLSGASSPWVRLLLVARAAGGWCDQVEAAASLPSGFLTRGEVPLPELETTPAARAAAAEDAAEDLLARLGEVVPYRDFDRTAMRGPVVPDVSAERFAHALNLQMAVLVALLQAIDPVDVEADEDDEAILLRHEQKFWQRAAGAFGLSHLDLRSRRRLVGVATLCQADDPAEAHGVLDRLGVVKPGDSGFADRVAEWLASLYPAENAYWGPLRPDRLGEYLVSIVTDDFPDLLGQSLPAAPRSQAVRAMRTLARADLHRPGTAKKVRAVVTENPDPLAFAAVTAATTVEHPEPLRAALSALTHDADADPDLLARLYDSTPVQSQALARWATELSARLAVEAEQGDPADLARRLNNHAIRLAAAGRHSEALEASGQSVAHRRTLAADGDVAALRDLTLALNTRIGSLADVDRHKEALGLAEELVRLCRRTTEIDPAGLPMAMYSLSVRQGAMSQFENSVTSAAHALHLYRGLAADDPATYDSDVALALDNQAGQLAALGEAVPALDAASAAVALYRRLAEESPDTYTEDLARALASAAGIRSELRHYDHALAAATESVQLQRHVVDNVPDIDPVWFIDALVTKAQCLSQVDRHDEAVALRQEAQAITSRLHESAPDIYQARHTRASFDIASGLQSAGRSSEALPYYDEALPIGRRLAAAQPTTFGQDFVLALHNFAQCWLALDDPHRALAALDEAEPLCRGLVELERVAHRGALVDILVCRVDTLRELGMTSPAVKAYEEAIALQRSTADDDPKDGLTDLVGMLNDFLDLLVDAGRPTASVAVAEELVEASRSLAERDVERYGPNLALVLRRHAIALSCASQDGALPVAEEAVDRCRALVDDDPEGFLPYLGDALHVLTVALTQAKQSRLALATAEENVELFDALAEEDPDEYLPTLVLAMVDHAEVFLECGQANESAAMAKRALELGTGHDDLVAELATVREVQAKALSVLGSHDESLAAAEAGLPTWRDLAHEEPMAHGRSLASMLRVYAEVLLTAGRTDQARAAVDEAVARYTELVEGDPDAFAADLEAALATQREIHASC